MAALTTFARPYARAAFEFADANQCLDTWSQSLRTLAAIVADEKVATALASPANTTDDAANILISLVGEDLDGHTQNFVRNLSSNKRLTLLGEISDLFDLMKANREKTVDVKVESAFPLDSSQQESLTAALGKHLNRTVSLQCEINPALLGGAVIHANDLVIDGSVKGRLAKLAEAIS